MGSTRSCRSFTPTRLRQIDSHSKAKRRVGIIVKVRIVKKRNLSSVNGEFYYIVAYIADDLASSKNHQANKRW